METESEDSMDFISRPVPGQCETFTEAEVEFFLNAGSVLLTPPESVLTEVNPESPPDFDALACENSNIRAKPRHEPFALKVTKNLKSDTGINSSPPSRPTYGDLDTVSDRQLLELKNSVISLASVLRIGSTSLQPILTDMESRIRRVLRRRLRKLARLQRKLNKMVADEQVLMDERTCNKPALSGYGDGIAAEKLGHIYDRQPALNDIDVVFPPKLWHCRIGCRNEVTAKQHFQFKAAVLKSYIERRLLQTTIRFESLLESAGASFEEICQLRQNYYSHAAIDKFLEVYKVNPVRFHDVTPVFHSWYNDNGSLKGVVRSTMTVRDLCKWKQNVDKKLSSITLNDISQDAKPNIDWMHVAKIMTVDCRCPMEPRECELLWINVVNPACEEFSWSQASLLKLMNTVERAGKEDWARVAQIMGKGISEFMCFTVYTNYCQSRETLNTEPNSITNWSLREKQIVLKEISQGADYDTAACALNSKLSSRIYSAKDVESCYFSTLLYKKSPFDPISSTEDAILLITVEKLAGFTHCARSNPLPIERILNWRTNEAWNNRLKYLVDPFQRRWTIQEDLKLLYLAIEFPGNWFYIARVFDGRNGPFRTATCLKKRHAKITAALATSTFLEFQKQQEINSKTILPYQNIRRAYGVLRSAKTLNESSNHAKAFVGFSDQYPPNDSDIYEWLSLENGDWIQPTVDRIERFVKFVKEEAPVTRYHDRRIFRRNDPLSMASVLHIRRMCTKPMEDMSHLSEFQKLVVHHLNNFYSKTRPKPAKNRPHLPTTLELRSFKELEPILKNPIRQTKEEKRILPDTAESELNGEFDFTNQWINLLSDSAVSADSNHNPQNGKTHPENAPYCVEFYIPTLRDSKGKKGMRLRNIRRLSAMKRWQNKPEKLEPQLQSTCVKKCTPVVVTSKPVADENPISFNATEDDSTSPSSPKRPRRNRKFPDRLVVSL